MSHARKTATPRWHSRIADVDLAKHRFKQLIRLATSQLQLRRPWERWTRSGATFAFAALRVLKLMRGGRSARREAELMVSEKIHAAFEATASLMAGASNDEIVHRYRRHVAPVMRSKAPSGSVWSTS
jgi:hypothetical protein